MTDFQKRLDKLLDLYLNGHEEKDVQAAQDEVAAMFKDFDGDHEATIQLYKFLPAQLSVAFMCKALQTERDHIPDAGIAKTAQASISTTAFPTDDMKKATYLALSECLEKQGKTKESQTALVSFLTEFKAGDKGVGYDLPALAAKALLGHLKTGLDLEMERSGCPWQFEGVLNLPAVKLLSSSQPEHQNLLKLVVDLAAGNCQVVQTFVNANKELVEKKWGLDSEALVLKVRLLALCALCSEDSAVTYADIEKKLGIEASEIEAYVINAMTAGLLSGKINSMAKSVQVKTVHRPVIGAETWTELSEKLLAWYSQVSKLVTTLDDVRVQQVKEDRESERIEANNRLR